MSKKELINIEELMLENKKLKDKIAKIETKLVLKEKEIEHLKYFYFLENQKINIERFVRLNVHYIRTNGILKYIASVFKSIFKIFGLGIKKVWYKFFPRPELVQLRKILKDNKDKEIILFYPGYEWYMKMYQRPQHIAVQMAKKNILYFYCTQNYTDNIHGFKKIQDNLYITDQLWLLKKHLPKYTLQVYANMNGCWLPELKEIQEQGLFDKEKMGINGVAIYISDVEKCTIDSAIMEVTKYRSALGAIFVKYKLEYKNDMWNIEVLQMAIS